MTSDNKTIVHPHDYFVRKAMNDLRVAREFFTVHLPPDIRSLINLNELSILPRSHINHANKEHIVDLLYKTKIADSDALIYLLLEHQSKPDELMPFRMLKYTCNIIDEYRRSTGSKKIPLVYPMVLYHGKSPYPCSTDIKDLVAAPKEIVEKYFLRPFQLIDLGQIKDEEIKRHIWTGAMEFVLKHIFERDIMPYFIEITGLLRSIGQSGGRDYVSDILQYLVERSQLKDIKEFVDIVNYQISPEAGENIMTLAERLHENGAKLGLKQGIEQGRQQGRQQGIEQGMQQGMQQGKELQALEIAKRLLSEGADLAYVSKITNLPVTRLAMLVKI